MATKKGSRFTLSIHRIASGTGLAAFYRHYNSSTGDYLLSTSSTPPSGYALQATLGCLQSGNTSSNNLVAYIRNPIGQIVQGKTQDVTYSYTYDNAHRVSTMTDSRGNKQLSYFYSNAGLLLTMQDSDGNRTDYDYDPTGRLTGIWAPNNDYTAFAYDDAGRLIEKWFPNGVNTQYAYNRDNTLKQLINRYSAGITVSQNDYTYDGVGNRISNTELINGTTNPYTYAYDPLNRLITVTNTSTSAVESYAYDPLGNRSTKTAGGSTLAYVYDSANQLLEIHSGSTGGMLVGGLVYDNNANLTKKCENGTVTVNSSNCTGNTVTDLTHDSFNRLAQVSKTAISTESYKYDDQGNRIQKTVGSTITNFLYNGPDVIGEYTSSWGTASAILTHGPGTDDPIIRVSGTTAQYFHQDGLGSVVSVTNQSGTTDGTARYDAWGNKIASTGTIPQYGYTGREPDDTGLLYYRARFYDPSIARFTQRDPIGMRAGLNLYAYVKGNPINFNDPMGLKINDPVATQLADASSTNYYGSIVNDAGSQIGLSAALQNLAAASGQSSSQTVNSNDIPDLPGIPKNLNGVPADLISLVFGEAGGQSYDANLGVANVVRNRVELSSAGLYPYDYKGKTYDSIIYQQGAFAAVREEPMAQAYGVLTGSLSASVLPAGRAAELVQSFQAAQAVYNGTAADNTNGATIFYSPPAKVPADITRGLNQGYYGEVTVKNAGPHFRFFKFIEY